MNTDNKLKFIPILGAFLLLLGFAIGKKTKLTPTPNISIGELANVSQEDLFIGNQPVEEVLRYIDSKYFVPIDKSTLSESAIRSIIQQLDPFSIYLSKDELSFESLDLAGEYGGIGINTVSINDTFFVSKILEQSELMQKDVAIGDAIIGVDSVSIIGMPANKVRQMVFGQPGTEIALSILKLSSNDTIEVKVKRVTIADEAISRHFMLADGIGYIKIDEFNKSTFEEFIDKVEELIRQHEMKDLVIDLRGNSGGYLNQAVKVINQLFAEKDLLIVYTEGEKSPKNEFKTTGNNFFEIGKIAVLIDELSASASEVLAGAVQDLDRGTILGQTSFGKGLVQTQFKLKDGGGLRLTTAKYFTPSGRCIQKDYDKGDSFEADSTVYTTSKGREVNGGGGIEPDVIVEQEEFDLDSDSLVFEQQKEMVKYCFNLYLNNPMQIGKDSIGSFADEQFKNYKNQSKYNSSKLSFYESKRKEYFVNEVYMRFSNKESYWKIAADNDKVIHEAVKKLSL